MSNQSYADKCDSLLGDYLGWLEAAEKDEAHDQNHEAASAFSNASSMLRSMMEVRLP